MTTSGRPGRERDRPAGRVVDGARGAAPVGPPRRPEARPRQQERVDGQRAGAEQPRRRQQPAADDLEVREALGRVVERRSASRSANDSPASGVGVEGRRAARRGRRRSAAPGRAPGAAGRRGRRGRPVRRRRGPDRRPGSPSLAADAAVTRPRRPGRRAPASRAAPRATRSRGAGPSPGSPPPVRSAPPRPRLGPARRRRPPEHAVAELLGPQLDDDDERLDDDPPAHLATGRRAGRGT